MSDSAEAIRREVMSREGICVVKVGTRVLTGTKGILDPEQVGSLSRQLCEIVKSGRKVVLVSSGAVGSGMSELGLLKRPSDVASLQAVAAVGQAVLINRYNEFFRQHGFRAAQVLLTADDLDNRTRYLNVRNTLLRLLDLGAIPVINENDTVAVDELVAKFGDNDRLAALVANLLRASLLVILSDVEGLYNGDPSLPESKLLPNVPKVDDSVFDLVRDKDTGLSRGGMSSKLKAAKMVTKSGENVIIAGGRVSNILTRLVGGEVLGTLFQAQGKSLTPWKRWLGFSARVKGELAVDDGAVKAISEKGKSLLAIGISKVKGEFAKGDVVSIQTKKGKEVARGLSNYSSDDLQRIRGLTSDEFAEILEDVPYEEVIHRDNLLVLD